MNSNCTSNKLQRGTIAEELVIDTKTATATGFLDQVLQSPSKQSGFSALLSLIVLELHKPQKKARILLGHNDQGNASFFKVTIDALLGD